MSTHSYSEFRSIAEKEFETPSKDKLEWLYKLNEEIVKRDKSIQEDPENKFDYTNHDKLEYLQGLVSQGIKHYSEVTFKGDYEQPRLGLN